MITKLKKNLLIFVLTAFCLSNILMPINANAESTNSNSGKQLDQKEVTEFVDGFFNEKNMEKNNITKFPGLVVTVVQGNDVLLNKGYGYADVEKKIPVNPNETLFRIASVTKSLTATALMQLVDQGKVDLEADIRTYFPDIKFKNPFNEPVKVKYLLLHNTGFEVRDPNIDDLHGDFKTYYSLEKYIKDNFPPVVRKPGTSYMYDNFSFLLQGYLIEKVTGQKYEDYMKEKFFTPLEMDHTHPVFTQDLTKYLATGYDVASGKALPLYNVKPTSMPSGGTFTTGGDMAKIMIAHLNGGSYNGKSILSTKSINMMHEYLQKINPDFPDTTYGFEAPYPSSSKEFVISKGGDLPGFSSYMWLIPDKKIGVFLSNNISGGPREEFYQAFMKKFFPSDESKYEFLKTSKKELEKFSGVYKDLRLRTFVSEVKAIDNGVLEVSNFFGSKSNFQQIAPLVFMGKSGQKLVFRETNGKIDYLKYETNVSYAEKLNDIKPFKDIKANHPYAKYIRTLQILNAVSAKKDGSFGGTDAVTRAEFLTTLQKSINFKLSKNPSSFKDMKGHKAESVVQTAVELGLVTPSSNKFNPDAKLTRQEAANYAFKLLMISGVQPLDAKLYGKTDKWAVPAVKTIVALKFYGPEIKPKKDGSVDYQSTKIMNRQEEAALIAKLVNQSL